MSYKASPWLVAVVTQGSATRSTLRLATELDKRFQLQGEVAQISQRELTATLSLSSVIRATRWLESHGFLEVERPKNCRWEAGLKYHRK